MTKRKGCVLKNINDERTFISAGLRQAPVTNKTRLIYEKQ